MEIMRLCFGVCNHYRSYGSGYETRMHKGQDSLVTNSALRTLYIAGQMLSRAELAAQVPKMLVVSIIHQVLVVQICLVFFLLMGWYPPPEP